jgi:diacylglycerol kinase
VLILEGLNTALEAVVDLASPDIHPLAKTAKDLTAGMVLLAAAASIVVGLIILGPPFAARLFNR